MLCKINKIHSKIRSNRENFFVLLALPLILGYNIMYKLLPSEVFHYSGRLITMFDKTMIDRDIRAVSHKYIFQIAKLEDC